MKFFLFFTIFLSFTYSYSQSNFKSGIIDYGVDLNDRVFKMIKEIDTNKDDDKYQKRIEASFQKLISYHKKIYSRDIPFLNLSFKKNTYILKPIEIMIPEKLQGKFIFQSKTYYHNINNCVYLKRFQSRGETYIAPLKREYNWEIKNEQKTILGYQCRKAVLEIPNNNKIIAWFTPQIPIAFSPVRYYGLPGAILEVTTPLKHIYAKNIEFKEDVEIEKPTEGIKLSKEEYQEMISRPGKKSK